MYMLFPSAAHLLCLESIIHPTQEHLEAILCNPFFLTPPLLPLLLLSVHFVHCFCSK